MTGLLFPVPVTTLSESHPPELVQHPQRLELLSKDVPDKGAEQQGTFLERSFGEGEAGYPVDVDGFSQEQCFQSAH